MKLRTRLRTVARDLTGFDVHRYSSDGALDFFDDAVLRFGRDSAITAFDVGANKGQTIGRISETFPNAVIHAFEPSPAIFREHLAPLATHNKKLRLNCCGVGAQAGELPLNENEQSEMSSFLTLGNSGWGKVGHQTHVPVTTIDGYSTEHGIESIDILKIDTQGFDFEVIKGADKMLASRRVVLMVVEITLDRLYDGLPRFDEIYAFMADRGYALTGVYDQHRSNGMLRWADFGFAQR